LVVNLVAQLANIEVFERHAKEYDVWFERNRAVYEAELRAVEAALPATGLRLEVGVGTGRFAARLGFQMGVDPSPAMAALARVRGVQVTVARAESLPFSSEQFDFVLMVTTICFIDDPHAALQEVARVLKPGGGFIVAFLDRDTAPGRRYLEKKAHDKFYRGARFYSFEEVLSLVRCAGFSNTAEWQTIFDAPEPTTEASAVKPGHGKGGFVVLRAEKRPCPN
jgi:ubiquinone/menaquinone biosynthesis C-methylase UbiE